MVSLVHKIIRPMTEFPSLLPVNYPTEIQPIPEGSNMFTINQADNVNLGIYRGTDLAFIFIHISYILLLIFIATTYASILKELESEIKNTFTMLFEFVFL